MIKSSSLLLFGCGFSLVMYEVYPICCKVVYVARIVAIILCSHLLSFIHRSRLHMHKKNKISLGDSWSCCVWYVSLQAETLLSLSLLEDVRRSASFNTIYPTSSAEPFRDRDKYVYMMRLTWRITVVRRATCKCLESCSLCGICTTWRQWFTIRFKIPTQSANIFPADDMMTRVRLHTLTLLVG